jgi:hypothetical protein
MPFSPIHSFTSTIGTLYEIYYNPDSTDIDTHVTGTQELTVTELELGVEEDFIFTHHCDGPDMIRVRAMLAFPFAYIDRTLNAPACGFGGGGCTLNITSITVTDETVSGAQDGSATVNTTGAGSNSVLYSLDNIHFQSSNFFPDLLPGSYTVYAKFSTGLCPIVIDNFTIAAGVVIPHIDYPWQERICRWFNLVVDGVTYVISEPIKWDSVNIVGKRDKDWHGFNYQFSDGVLELEFDCAAGKDVIEAEYDAHGNDGEVFFNHGYTYLGTDYTLFEGKLNLNTRKKYPGKVSCSVEKKDFNNLFQSRYETKVSMKETQSIDGVAITPPSVVDFILHAKELQRNYSLVTTDVVDMPQTVIGGQDAFFQYESSVPQLNEIEENFPYPINVTSSAPYNQDRFNWEMKFAGTYNFDSIAQHIVFTFYVPGTEFGKTVSFRVFLRKNNLNTHQIGTTVSATLNQTIQTITVNVAAVLPNVIYAPGDKVYIYTEIHFSHATALGISAKQMSLDVRLTSLESTEPTDCKGWFLFDAANHATRVITNNTTRIKSKFLSLQSAQQAADGAGSLYITTNGKQIRQYQTDLHPLKISTKDILESIRALFCIGMGMERAGLMDIVRIERANYFYQNREIIVIDECYGYREEVAKDMIYNEFEFGYEKFQEDGYNTLDEFNTKQERVGPIKTNKLKIVQKSKLIGSGYSIETSRRQQFANSATDSFQNDEDGFVIAMRRLSNEEYAPEKDEAFDVVNNVISPSTAYNLRISPIRMIINWAIWLYNVFHFKPTTDKITHTSTLQNENLETQFSATELNPIGDLNKILWQEKQHITLSDYAVEERLYRPEWVYFKCRLTPDKIQLINEALTGARNNSVNYGYVAVKDDGGLYQAIWVYELSYNYASELAEFKGLKKFDSPVIPGAGCCNELMLNGCFVKINGSRIIL